MRGLTATLVLFLVTTSAGAHPVPADNRDRTVVIRLTPAGITIEYRLEIDELSATRELPDDEIKRIESRQQIHAAASRYLAGAVANNLVVQLDGKDYPLRCTQRSLLVTDHLRLEYHFAADWVLPKDGTHRFSFRESNWDQDEVSKLAIRLTGSDVTLTEVRVPSEALINRPAVDRRTDDMEKLRTATANVEWGPQVARGYYKPGLPPDPEPVRQGPEEVAAASLGSVPLQGERIGEDKPAFTMQMDLQVLAAQTVMKFAAPNVASVALQILTLKRFQDEAIVSPPSKEQGKPTSETLPPLTDATVHTHSYTLLDLLFDTRLGLAMLLLLAGLFGAAHALTPGHGKTLVAAYLVGERGTIGHAILLGIVVTLTHTSAVLLVAIIVPLCFPKANPVEVQTFLELVGGLLIAGLGCWLLLTRLAGRADHIHLGGGHHHVPQPADKAPVGWRGLVLLGISGGIVPCGDAVVLLGVAISKGRMWMGLPLLLAFSAGLAGVLVAIGISVVSARGLLSRWVGKQNRTLNLVARGLPLASAVMVTVLGLWLCYDVSLALQVNR